MNGSTIMQPEPMLGLDSGALPQQGRWYVLHIKSRQEKLLSEELRTWGIAHFLPMVRQTRHYGKRKAYVQLPLFSGYVFLRGEIDDAYASGRTRRVARIIDVSDQDRLTWELCNLHRALSSQVPLDPYRFLKKGLRVEVRSGPLRGLQGFVEDRLTGGRLVLQVEMLGQAVSVEVEGARLEVI